MRDVAYEAGVVELITRLIARGLGIVLLPSAFIRPRAAGDPGLALVPVVVDGPRRIECLVWTRFNPHPGEPGDARRPRTAVNGVLTHGALGGYGR